jgi:hypothetical protein
MHSARKGKQKAAVRGEKKSFSRSVGERREGLMNLSKRRKILQVICDVDVDGELAVRRAVKARQEEI